MKIKPFSFVVFSLLIIFAVVSFGGCGGSSSSFNGGNGNNGGGGGTSSAEYYVLDFENPDTDGDGIPDVLDFGDIEEEYYGKDDIIIDRKISVPSRHYLGRFKKAVESPDSFVVDLTAGTEYTVEISKGIRYEYPIAESVPNVEIINPQGNTLSFLDFGTFDENYDSEAILDLEPDVIELSVYPQEEPYTVCLTFTPATTGSYTINLNQVISDDGDYDNVKTLFVYEELRNDDTGEAGYYKRFKFEDADGNVSETISMTDITELRKTYNITSLRLMETYLELVLSGDIEWNDDDLKQNNDYALEVYDDALQNLRQRCGLFDIEVYDYDVAEEDESETEVSSSAAKDDNAKTKTTKNKTVTEGKLKTAGTEVPSSIVGIPYTDTFLRGTGFFGITGIQAGYEALEEFTLPVPKEKHSRVRYIARFISSQEERNDFAKTYVNASLQLGGFGLKAGYSESSSFKYGLTSGTFVIHYEEAEEGYRYLANSKYQLTDAAKDILNNQGSKEFRERFGDYFVAGYKYGGTYDAFISVTTETTEQLKEVKMYLEASYNAPGKAASADVGNETKDFLKKRNASVTIEIRTAGINTDSNVSKHSTIDAGIDSITSQLEEFQKKLQKSKPKDYMPCYVMLKRYSLLSPVLSQLAKEKDKGLVPIPASHSQKVLNFNKAFMILEGYYNVIEGLSAQQINTSIKDALGAEYDAIANEIQAYGNNFYLEENASRLAAVHKKVKNLSARVKALGDRYVFHRVLVGLQAEEKRRRDNAVVDGKLIIYWLPYGPGGGSIGVQSYPLSTAVESDINAGKGKEKTSNYYKYNWWADKYDIDFDAGEGYIFHHIEINAPNTHDIVRDSKFPTIATRNVHYHFEPQTARYAQWDFKLRPMRFNSTLYPFYGLN